ITKVTCVASDTFGNTNTTFFNVQVTGSCDAGYIAIYCPSNIQVPLGTLPDVQVNFDVPATNLLTLQPYPVQCSPPSGSRFPAGSNLVTCVASAGGASNVCSFAVVVTDSTPPVVRTPRSFVTPSRATNSLGQAGAYVYFQANASDNAGVTLSYL